MTVTENPPQRRFTWPADHYASATPNAVLPRWATFGCGAAALVVLLLVSAGGVFLSSGGFITFLDFAIGMSVAEMKGQFAPDVTAAQKQSLDDEYQQLSKNLRERKISLQTVQPFLLRLRAVSEDRKVTAAEASSLQAVARKINEHAKR
jgi:heme exporter protein D